MNLPFTSDQFLEVFKSYNENIFPVQIIFYLAAFFILYHLFNRRKNSSLIISSVIGFFWLWTGLVYHITYFSRINKAAFLFGSLFILQGIIFLVYGILLKKLIFVYNKTIYNYTGLLIILYALFIYPILGYFLGRAYPYSITVGLPCPTTIFTFGVLLFIENKISSAVLIIPLLWSILGFSAALNFTVYEDFGLLVSGITAFIMLLLRNRRIRLAPQTI